MLSGQEVVLRLYLKWSKFRAAVDLSSTCLEISNKKDGLLNEGTDSI